MRSVFSGLTIALLCLTASAHADERITLPRFYLEGQAGIAVLSDRDSKPVTGSGTVNGSPVSYTNFVTNLTNDAGPAYGAEIGIRNLLNTRVRLGLAWTTFHQKVHDVKGTGAFTTTGGTYSLGAGSTPPTSALLAAGIDYDNRINIYTANAYYDFRPVMWHRPYVGLGIGTADIENSKKGNLTLTGSVGTQVTITRNLYAGVKLTGYWIKGQKDGLIDYKPLTVGTAMFTTGVHF